MMERLKFSKLGLALLVVHSVIAITIAILDSLNFSTGYGLMALLVMDIPATSIIMRLADFIDSICKISPYILIPILSVIFGGLQWYGVGWFISWLISKLKKVFHPPQSKGAV